MSNFFEDVHPYNFVMGNPIMAMDPDGDTVHTENNTASQEDLLSLVDPSNRNRISFNEEGILEVDVSGLTVEQIEKDKGLSLLNDLSASDKNMLYISGDIGVFKNNGVLTVAPISLTSHGIINASNFGKDSNNGHTHQPRDGYDGQVIISASGQYQIDGVGDARKSVVFHELAEMYFRTHLGIDYNDNKSNGFNGAHNRAANREGRSFNNNQPGAILGYSRPIYSPLEKEILTYIYKNIHNEINP